MTYYCPVCYKEIPEKAYGGLYQGCIEMRGLDKETGFAATSQGTIKLGKKPGEFDSVFPKKIFTECYNAIRAKQKTGSVRIAKCNTK